MIYQDRASNALIAAAAAALAAVAGLGVAAVFAMAPLPAFAAPAGGAVHRVQDVASCSAWIHRQLPRGAATKACMAFVISDRGRETDRGAVLNGFRDDGLPVVWTALPAQGGQQYISRFERLDEAFDTVCRPGTLLQLTPVRRGDCSPH